MQIIFASPPPSPGSRSAASPARVLRTLTRGARAGLLFEGGGPRGGCVWGGGVPPLCDIPPFPPPSGAELLVAPKKGFCSKLDWRCRPKARKNIWLNLLEGRGGGGPVPPPPPLGLALFFIQTGAPPPLLKQVLVTCGLSRVVVLVGETSAQQAAHAVHKR